MSINAKHSNIMFQNPIQKNQKGTYVLGRKAIVGKPTNICKTSKIEGNKHKSKQPLKTIDENDIPKKNLFEKDDINFKDDSEIKETEKDTKEIVLCDLGLSKHQSSSSFSLTNSSKETSASSQSNFNSFNLENFITNTTLGKNGFSTDEYREMFTKLVRDDYSKGILNTLLQDEELNEEFLSRHKITERMRTRMVDWMIEVLSNYHCDEATFFEAVNLMDRYFKQMEKKGRTLQPGELHLIGVTSMFMASKYQDIYPLRLRIIHEKIAHRKLSCEEIRNKEEEIAKSLNYSIGKPNMWDFINLFVEEIFFVNANKHHISSKVLLDNYYEDGEERNREAVILLNKLYTKNMINLLNHVCIYLGKMNCHDYSLMQKKPSLLAASTIFVAIKICEQINKEDYINDYFTSKLNEISQKNEADIIKTAQKILYNAQNFDTLFNGLDNLKKVHFNAIIELKNTK